MWCFITWISNLIRKHRGKLSRTLGEMLLLMISANLIKCSRAKHHHRVVTFVGRLHVTWTLLHVSSPFATSSYVATDTGGFGYTSPHPCVIFIPLCFPSFSSPIVATKEWFKHKRKWSQGLLWEQSTFCGLMKDETNYKIIIIEKYRQQPQISSGQISDKILL